MNDGDQVIIDGVKYRYDKYYDRLKGETEDAAPAIACPRCNNTEFTLSYGNYELVAHCKCGQLMTVYDG